MPLGVKIARREILYLFEAYCTLLRAASEAKDDVEWLGQVEKNGGIIVAVEGIQQALGNETVYLVRDALTGRVLAAENVTSSETAVMKALLAPVVALGVKVLGTITDAQESALLAVEQLWPSVPHQVCQFHALRDAIQPAYEADRAVKTAMGKQLQPKLKAVRKQLKRRQTRVRERLKRSNWGSWMITLSGRCRRSTAMASPPSTSRQCKPARSWMTWQPVWTDWKKGGAVSLVVAQKLRRLQVILAERTTWVAQLGQVKGMRQWVLDAEHILDGSWAQADAVVTNARGEERLDAWRQQMAEQLTDVRLSELEQECLTEFLRVLTNLRPYLVQCYDRQDFPRINNELERSIRCLKTQYRRISGRKNGNSYLLRYGRCVAYATWWEQDAAHQRQLEQRAARLGRTRLPAVPTGDQRGTERAAQALSLPEHSPGLSQLVRGTLGCRCHDASFALTVFSAQWQTRVDSRCSLKGKRGT